jgi:hypothetical protein
MPWSVEHGRAPPGAVVRPGEQYYIHVGPINPTIWRVTVQAK